MTATLLPGSATLFSVEGETLCCANPNCHYTAKVSAKRQPGGRCPRCELGETLQLRQYQVDAAAFQGFGQCGCESWEFHIGPRVRRMTPTERLNHDITGNDRCKHIKAAREAYRLWPSYLTQLLRAVTQEAEGGP